jgi:hypothetical protein
MSSVNCISYQNSLQELAVNRRRVALVNERHCSVTCVRLITYYSKYYLTSLPGAMRGRTISNDFNGETNHNIKKSHRLNTMLLDALYLS